MSEVGNSSLPKSDLLQSHLGLWCVKGFVEVPVSFRCVFYIHIVFLSLEDIKKIFDHTVTYWRSIGGV